MQDRQHPSLTDYLLVGINPALIMVLVGSLVFFLLEALYEGQYDERLRFIFGLFVMAIVCIARISINEGKGQATLFAIPLALVTALAMSRFVDYSGALAPFKTFLNWGLMGLVWWAAHQLTWDCTVVDEAADASGAGLFQQLGWTGREEQDAKEPRAAAPLDEPEGLTSHEAPSTATDEGGLWSWLRRRLLRKHTPGVWVVYFSLAALPIFGLGQSFISAQDAAGRSRSHTYLACYVGAGLALLVSTSFLNLRRYLRKRRVDVSDSLTFRWLAAGAVLVLAVVVVSWLLPGPGALDWANPLAYSRKLDPSRWGWGNDGPQSPEGTRPGSSAQDPASGGQQSGGQQSGGQQSGGQQSGGQQSGGQQSGGQQSGGQQSGGQQSGGQQSGGQQSGGQLSGGQQSGGQQSGGQQSGGQQSGGQQSGGQQAGAQSSGGSTVARAVEQISSGLAWIVRLAAVLGLLFAAWLFRDSLRRGLQSLLDGWRAWWAGLFGRSPAAAVAGEAASAAVPLKPPPAWAEFSDPFRSGMADRVAPGEVIRYSFAALDAWGRAIGRPRGIQETPLEYAGRLAAVDEQLSREARLVAEYYGYLAYARGVLPAEASAAARRLWQRLAENAANPIGPAPVS